MTGVRFFLGLANQLSGFIPDFAHMSVHLRALTAKKNAFLWLQDHQEEFEKINRLFTSDMVIMHFDPNLPVTILTDASQLHGLGYAMGHFINGKFGIVACVSKSLTPTQQRYATIELECLGVHFAVDKCSFYLKGAPSFKVVTDHKPLEGIFKKDLFDIGNLRLQRIPFKLLEYNFTVTWVPGKSHLIADALSRAPLFAPEEVKDIAINTAPVCLTKSSSNVLNIIFDAIDSDYIKLRQDVCDETFGSTYANQLKSIMSQLSVDEDLVYLDAARIVLPKNAVKVVLPSVHTAHIGMNKTYELCGSLYFWPGMYNDIKQMIVQCKPCNIYKPSQPKNP